MTQTDPTAISLTPHRAPDALTTGFAVFFSPPGGTDFGMLEDGGPPGETGRAAVPDG